MLGSLLSSYLPLQTFSSSGTLLLYSKILEIDASAGDVVITLGAITASTIKFTPMIVNRIDNSLNTVTFNGTGGNFPEQPLNMPVGDDFTLYATNTFWRTIG